MTFQYAARVLRIAGLGVLMAAAFASAGVARECKSEAVVAQGHPATLRDLGAYPNSLFAWRKAVAEKYGPEFNSWRYAEKRSVDCKEKDGSWICKREALPCKDTLSTVIAGEKLEKFTCKNDPVSSYGRREAKESAAVDQAKWAWRIDVGKKYDASWAKWDNATGADFDCRKVGDKFQCVGVGTPCKEK
ncbi:hypothetical protein [Hyphomicrobium sp.]|uniref:hypothetical protein n=1 Tax=Hyphomicrobium sp. TaxID=82 RepID=UPI0025C4FD0C|nr:hypothetical protein [Hyphomicrobium sp.]MCC7251447.1 hypothetical protein [Hyphomicrobium sp.]